VQRLQFTIVTATFLATTVRQQPFEQHIHGSEAAGSQLINRLISGLVIPAATATPEIPRCSLATYATSRSVIRLGAVKADQTAKSALNLLNVTASAYPLPYSDITSSINKKAVLPQRNRAMPQLFFSV